MTGRYYLTGVQLGLLICEDKQIRLSTMQTIIDNQFIGNTGDEETDKIMETIEDIIRNIAETLKNAQKDIYYPKISNLHRKTTAQNEQEAEK